jgi:putative polyhydroxyalkanoate system protein
MPSIDIRRRHHQDRQQARAHVDRLAARLREKFGVQTHWEADTLRLRHTGIDGGITVDDAEVRVQARLGMLLGALKPRIEREIHEKLDAYFGPERTG